MLVFMSDIHMTDGSSGETIKSTAFRIFSDNVKKLVQSLKPAPPEELRIVLLGDVFDIIRSGKWLDVADRPWDSRSPSQERIVNKILASIIENNRASLAEIEKLRQWSLKKQIPFHVTYVIGNHDWIINRYPACIKKAAEAFGEKGNDPFPTEFFDSEYKAFARHGDIYDSFNHMDTRDESSLGDAIVIELLNRFPEQVAKNLKKLVTEGVVSSTEANHLSTLLKEIDNIQPLLSVPAWVIMVMNKTSNQSVRRTIEKTWTDCVNNFFKVPFVKKQDKFLWPDMVDLLQIALHLSSHLSKKTLEKIVEFKEKWFPEDRAGGYDKYAVSETKVRTGEASFVFYGHTHDHLIIPMDQTPEQDGSIQDKLYFNTGTWRKTWNRVKFDPANREFIGWDVLTYIALFKPTENGRYNFEVWNGLLG